MGVIPQRRARGARSARWQPSATTFAAMSVIGAMPLIGRLLGGSTAMDIPPLGIVLAVVCVAITVLLPAGLALLLLRAPELAARRLAPVSIPAALLWAAALTLPVWALLLWPLSFLALAGLGLMAIVIGSWVADIGVEFLAGHRRNVADWVCGLALVLPVLGVVVAIGVAAVAVWG